jgi:hypothetical protein
MKKISKKERSTHQAQWMAHGQFLDEVLQQPNRFTLQLECTSRPHGPLPQVASGWPGRCGRVHLFPNDVGAGNQSIKRTTFNFLVHMIRGMVEMVRGAHANLASIRL